jgi:hypothetical protein|tara:strand:- start:195 stop:377 length:183 start_codon:yes stop_codon:yes gene_type:complete
MKSVDYSHENKRVRLTFEENQVFIKKKWTRKGIIAVIIEQAKRNNLGELFNYSKKMKKGE